MPVAKTGAQQVAKLLREYARRTALRGGNPYRAKAYARAADSVAALVEPLDRIVAEDRLTDVPGIGEAIADIVAKLHRTGTHPSLEKLRKEVPDGVLELLSVPGLKPEKALRLHNDLGISSIAELEAAAKDDRIRQRPRGGVANEDPAEPRDREKRRRQAAYPSRSGIAAERSRVSEGRASETQAHHHRR